MLFGRYVFSVVLEDDAVLPVYKGSTLRGLFGHALKKVVCALRHIDCTDCLLRSRCIYIQIFETATESLSLDTTSPVPSGVSRHPARKRIVKPPHPYVLEPPMETRTHYRPHDRLDFTLLLFGMTNDHLPYFIYAFHEMGRQGIGQRINGRRGAFILECVTTGGNIIYDRQTGKLDTGLYTSQLELADEPEASPERLSVHLITPLRLKYDNHLKAELPFHILIRAVLRRISSLGQYYGHGEPALDYRGLVKRALEITASFSTLRWFDWKRYSNRQEQAMLMGGMVGQVTYAGPLAEFLPLLQYCEIVHIGKQTTFGLGRIEVVPGGAA